MRRSIRARVGGRQSARGRCRLTCEQLENRTTPTVAALDGLLAHEPPGGAGAFTILDPIPALVAGVSPDSPSLRIDANTTSSPYAGVVGILIHSTQGNFLCSGTAISPTHILTAAHCLDIDNDGDSEEITGFTISVNYGGSPLTTIEASSWIVHPDWTGFNNPSINDDLGIITLQQPLPAGVPIYPLNTGSLTGQVLTLVGYGTTGTPSGYITGTATTTIKRVGQNVVGAYIGQDDAGRPVANEVWRADFDGSTSSTNTLNDGLTLGNSLEATLGGGDSGGPSFVNVGGQLYLAGVNTHTAAVFGGFFQVFSPPAYGSVMGGINVASYVGWINGIIGAPPDTSAPAAPTGLTATAGNNQVALDWANNSEPDLAGYNAYRSTTSGSGFTKINASLVSNSAYLDGTGLNGTTYFYLVTAVDTAGNESAASNEASATPAGSGGTSPGTLYFTLQNNGTVGSPGFTAANEDIIAFDGVSYLLFFDGSAFGLGGPSGGFSTDAVAVFQNGGTTEILMSFAQAGVISGTSLGLIYDADVVKFTVTAFNPDGSVAAGVWSWFFDGSDVGLGSGLFNVNSAEGVDGIDVLSDGRLLISTHGDVSVPGVSATDEDILVFTPTSLGANTAGSWAVFFDGTDVGLTADTEDVVGFTVLHDGGGYTLYLSTLGNFAVAGVSGTGGDVFVFHPTSLGNTTAGTYDSALFLDGSAQGLGANNVLDVSFKKSFGLPASIGLHGSRQTSEPAAEIHNAGLVAQGGNVSAELTAPSVNPVAVGSGVSTTFTQPTAAGTVNHAAAGSFGGDVVQKSWPSRAAAESGRVVVAHSAPSAMEATDSAPSAPAAQRAASANSLAETPASDPSFPWLPDACYPNELFADWLDGVAAAESDWFSPTLNISQVVLSSMVFGFVNAPIQAKAVENKENRFPIRRLQH